MFYTIANYRMLYQKRYVMMVGRSNINKFKYEKPYYFTISF